MTRTISLIIGITATVLSVGVAPALGEGRLAGSIEPTTVAPDWFERAANDAIANAESTPIVSERTPEAQALVAERLRSEALNRKYGLGEFARAYRDAHERVVEPQSVLAERLRSEGLNRMHGLGEFAAPYRDAHERVVEPQSLVAERLRSEALNRKYGLGEFATSNGYIDSHERAVQPVSGTPVTATPTVSDRDIQWPQLGIGFGIGIALAFGLVFAMRTTRSRPLAH